MKKLTARYKLHLLRKSTYVVNRQRKTVRLHSSEQRKLAKLEQNTKSKTIVRISAPENFIIGYAIGEKYPEARLKLLSFIANIKHSLRAGKKIHISFKNTKLLAPSGTLVFVAELERIIDKHPGRISIGYPNDDVVEQLFQHIGLLKRVGLPHRKEITAENVRHWNYVYGTNVDTTEFKNLFSKYAEEISEDVRSGLFDSMSEAVTKGVRIY